MQHDTLKGNSQSPNQYIEQTNLKQDLTEKAVDELMAEAIEYQFVGICVPPFWVKKCKRDLSETNIQVVTVIGFPLGYQKTESKLEEIHQAIKDGADELDMVMNVSAFKSGLPWAKIDIAKCVQLIHSHEKIAKVIVETALLDEEELAEVSKMVSDAGADYIKTSTGFAARGASVRDVEIMKANISSQVGIKASGGIKSWAEMKNLLAAGADRIGTSSGVKILEEFV